LAVGTRGATGHPRYDAFDAIILSLMHVLTVESGLPARRAASILDKVRDELRKAVENIVDEQELTKRWRWDGGPYLHIKTGSHRAYKLEDKPTILLDDELLRTVADQDSGACQIIVPLPRNVCRTLLSLENVLAGRKAPYSED
jgi:hypothetical protein